jgi:DNA-binding CsgD family transcriptional regulator/quercetin dioxygenase-like cupin family protein
MTASPGIVVLDRSGYISFTTDAAAALLRLGDGLTVRSHRLIGRQGSARLEDAVRATLAEAPGAPCSPLRTVVLRRRDQLPLIATLTPLTTTATGPLGALVLLHDPAATPRPSTEMLRHAFGLTAAEASVGQALLQGGTLHQIAEQRQVSLNTIRTLLARVLSKTGAHRQADLIRLLMPLMLGEAVQAGFDAGFRLGTAGGTPARWPVHPMELLRVDLALATRQEARITVSGFEAGTGTPVHRHSDAHEIVYVLGGSNRGEWGEGESRQTGTGELLHYGPNLRHSGRNPGTVANRLLVTRIVRLGPAPHLHRAARHPSG